MAKIRDTTLANQGPVPPRGNLTLGKGRKWIPARKLAVGASLSVLLLAFCVYRILTFVPRQFDAPGTLRPVLYTWFREFIKHYSSPEQAQQAWGTYCIFVLLIPTILALLNYLSHHSVLHPPVWVQKAVGSHLIFSCSVAACLIVCRFPSLLLGQTNPDEPLFLAAAHKLFSDPLFFRAVDLGTSGPLNILPLMLPAVFGISPDYASARLVALVIILVSIYLIYRTFALLADEDVAEIAVLPTAGVFAVVKHRDFQYYISEHVSLLLLAWALYLCVKTFRRPESHGWRVAGLGMLTAAAFLAKMQAVPIIGCIALVAIAYIYASGHAWRLWRPFVLVAVGLMPLLALNAVVCAAGGVWYDFWMEYIVGNFRYAEAHGTLGAEISRLADFVLNVEDIRVLIVALMSILAAYAYRTMRRSAVSGQALFLELAAVSGVVGIAGAALLRPGSSSEIAACAGVFAFALLPGSFLLLYRSEGSKSAPMRWSGFLTGAVLGSAIVAVYAPHHAAGPFGHYLLLLVFPLTMAMAWPVLASCSGRPLLGAKNEDASPDCNPGSAVPFVLLFTTATAVCQLCQLGAPDFISFARVPPSVRPPGSEIIDLLTQPADGITVWGWDSPAYLGAGRVSASKDIVVANLFSKVGQEVPKYYRESYLRDLRRHTPKLFVDAIGTSWWGSEKGQKMDFEVIPEISAFIQSNYVHVLDAYGQRFYIRRDLARSVAGIGDARKCDAQAIRCFEASAGAEIPADLPPVQMPEHSLIEATFTPEGQQDRLATVFSNEGSVTVHEGFQFLHMENDRYRLGVGWGPEGRLSDELWLPQRKPVYLAIEFNGNSVTLTCNGVKRLEMQLPRRMLDSPAPITIGSWMEHQRPFRGNIQFFQIRSLGQARRSITAKGR